MKTKIIAGIIFLTVLIVGCGSSNDNPAAPPLGEGSNGNGSNNTTVTFSGMSSGTFNADVAFLRPADECDITLGETKGGKGRSLILHRGKSTNTGNYNISLNDANDFSGVMTAPNDTAMYYFYNGNVKIDEISDTKVSGSFSCQAHPFSLVTGITDSTKVLNISANFNFLL